MCEECDAARETKGAWRRYDPVCPWCGARLIQAIRSLVEVDKSVRSNRMAVALADWVSYGHSESRLRELSASTAPMPLAPSGEPARRSPTKPP